MLHSLAAQVDHYSTYIRHHHGWEYVGVYADEAKTGTRDSRENFQRMLTDCRAGKIDHIITKSISRFSRNTVTLLEMVVPFNVADRATPPKTAHKEAQFFKEGEVIKISEALRFQPLKWRCITTLMIYTGARRGEIMGLKWDSIDYEAGEIKIQRNLLYSSNVGIYVDTPKSGDSRTIAVDSEVLELLKRQQLEQTRQRLKMGTGWKDTGFCFTQENGEPMHPDSITGWLDEFSKSESGRCVFQRIENPHRIKQCSWLKVSQRGKLGKAALRNPNFLHRKTPDF